MSIFSTTLGKYIKSLKQHVCVERERGIGGKKHIHSFNKNLCNKTGPGAVLSTAVLETE